MPPMTRGVRGAIGRRFAPNREGNGTSRPIRQVDQTQKASLQSEGDSGPRMLRLRVTLIAAQALLLALVPLVPAALAAGPVTVVITDTLDPKEVTVEPGTTVTWRNDHTERHRIRSQSGPVEFDSGNLEPGQAYSMRFDVAGTYTYLDERNESNTEYHGTIVVSAETPPTTTPPPGGGGSVTVDVINRSYRPASITIDPGTTVIWGNIDDRPHTVTARDRSFDSGIFDTGGSYSRTFNTSGTFEYFCTLHPDMIGTVAVRGSGGTPPPPAPPPPDPQPPQPPPPPASGDVTIFDNGYTPATMTITPGSTVTWVNTGSLPHTATDTARRFDSGILMSGNTYTRTFPSEGTFNYICTIHPEMTATITVSGGGGSVPPPPDPGPEPPPEAGTSPPPSGAIKIVDNAFSPANKTVPVGTLLTWANTGALPHTVTDRARSFDSGLLLPGATYSKRFTTAGTFNYICTLHPEMTATITVMGADGTAPPASAPVETQSASQGDVGPSSVRIVDNDFRPSNMKVAAGSTITWANTGALPHTVTDRAGEFDSGLLMSGDSYRRTFRTAGIFEYFCTIHPEMAGTITVTEGGTPVGSDDPTRDDVGAESDTGSASTQSDLSAGGSSTDVSVVDLDYDPREVTITAGSTVVWTNRGDLPHTVTAEAIFDSGIMGTGDSFSWTFPEPGRYDYLCTLHPNMIGTVIVEADNAESGAQLRATDTASLIPEPDPSPSALLEVVIVIGLASIVVVMVFSLGRALRLLRTD